MGLSFGITFRAAIVAGSIPVHSPFMGGMSFGTFIMVPVFKDYGFSVTDCTGIEVIGIRSMDDICTGMEDREEITCNIYHPFLGYVGND